MVSKEKLENFILETGLPYEEIGDGIWILYDNEINRDEKLIVSHEDTLVHFRMKVMPIPADCTIHCELFKKLLESNVSGLVHGSFGIEDNSIILIDSLQAENLDFNEFQASVEALFFGIVENYDELSKYLVKKDVAGKG